MKFVIIPFLATLSGTAAIGQPADPIVAAVASGHCQQTGIKSATYLSSGALQITCKRSPLFQRRSVQTVAPEGAEATNFVPLFGALGPALAGFGAAGAGILAIAGGSSSSSDTQ